MPGPVGDDPARLAVTLVVPARNASAELPALLAELTSAAVGAIVVDDGSTDETATVAAAMGAHVVKHDRSLGPAAARNTGWRRAETPIVLFADADTRLPSDLAPALAHFADAGVGMVVPRVRPAFADGSARTVAERYEEARSPYDLGDEPGEIGPGRRLGYATSALVLVRVEALESIGGFAEDLRFGEDFDLVQRLDGAGWTIRYEPTCVGSHAARDRLRDLLVLHHHYGRPFAELAKRAGRPAGSGSATAGSLVAAGLVLRGHPVVALAALGTGAAARASALRPGLTRRRSVATAVQTEVAGMRTIGALLGGAWLPLAALLSWRSPRGRALTASTVAARHLLDWRERRPALSPAAWVALRSADDVATASGVWRGCIRARSLGPLLPRFVPTRGAR